MKPDDIEFSVVRGGPFYRLRAKLGLIPEHGLALTRRCVVLVGVTWLPVVLGAILEGRAFEGADPLLRHFGVHARLLVSVPLLLFAEAVMEQIVPAMCRHFVASGLVGEESAPRFFEILRRAEAVRDSAWGTALVCSVMIAVVLASFSGGLSAHELAWFGTASGGGFAGFWYSVVCRPVFAGLLAIWFWRIVTLVGMLRQISSLDLQFVATHPDRAGGLGFLESMGVASAPIVMATSVVMAGRWGHDVLYHGVHVDSLKPLMATFVAVMLILFAGPMLLLSSGLRRFKKRSLLQFGSLVGNQGRLVYQKWITGSDVGAAPILTAPEIGPVADAITLYEAAARMRIAPIGARLLLPIAIAAAAPILPVFAIEIPIKQLLKALAGALI